MEAGGRRAIGCPQHTWILRLDIKRRWFGVVTRWDPYPATDVQESSPVDQTKDKVAGTRRVAVVSSTSRLLAAVLYHLTCLQPLREVSAPSSP